MKKAILKGLLCAVGLYGAVYGIMWVMVELFY